MIVGHGDIASVLVDRPDRVYFAAGVSNSRETRRCEFDRELDYLCTVGRDRHLVYFSTLSVFYGDSSYVHHKHHMEVQVRRNFELYTIIRLGNITWGNNPHTLINYIRERIRTRQPVEIRDEYRYIVDKDEFLHWIEMIPPWSCEMNITGRRMKVKDIVREYCYPWGKLNGAAQHDHTEPELSVCQ